MKLAENFMLAENYDIMHNDRFETLTVPGINIEVLAHYAVSAYPLVDKCVIE